MVWSQDSAGYRLARCAAAALLAVMAGLVQPASASVIMNGTRVIISGDSGQTSMQLSNEGQQPALIQAWVDEGNAEAPPEEAQAPFVLTPTLFRIEAGSSRNLRILYAPALGSLPQDHESVFWLNVLEIPPKPTGLQAQQNLLQFAVRSRFKLFYRPSGLKDSPMQAAGQLVAQRITRQGQAALALYNPTAYYVSVVGVHDQAADIQRLGQPVMVPPAGQVVLDLTPGFPVPAAGAQLMYDTVTDYGGTQAYPAVVQAQD